MILKICLLATIAATSNIAQVEYGSKSVQLGNNLTLAETAKMPTVISWTAEPNALYTLIFSDPDVPSEQDSSGRSFRHWLVTNIPGADVGRGSTVRPYIGPGALPNTGVHRYNFLVYKQPGQITSTDPTDGYNGPDKARTFMLVDYMFFNDPVGAARIRDSIHWSPERFAAKHGLGFPIAGNFFRAEYTPVV